MSGPNNQGNIKGGVVYFIVNEQKDLEKIWINMNNFGVNLHIMANGVEVGSVRFNHNGANKTMVDLR